MNKQIIIDSFQGYLKEKGFDEKSLSLSNVPELFVDYYRNIKFDGFVEENDSDILLFQYGTYNWQKERYFQLNFTRQLYEVYKDESHQIYQLGLTFFYSPDGFSNISSFNKWTKDFSDLTDFLDSIINSGGFNEALNEIPLRKEIVVYLI